MFELYLWIGFIDGSRKIILTELFDCGEFFLAQDFIFNLFCVLNLLSVTLIFLKSKTKNMHSENFKNISS